MYEAHRIICTGNFADSNRTCNKITATLEFTDYISKEDIMDILKQIFAERKMYVLLLNGMASKK